MAARLVDDVRQVGPYGLVFDGDQLALLMDGEQGEPPRLLVERMPAAEAAAIAWAILALIEDEPARDTLQEFFDQFRVVFLHDWPHTADWLPFAFGTQSPLAADPSPDTEAWNELRRHYERLCQLLPMLGERH